MKKIVIVGGSGGLGKKVAEQLEDLCEIGIGSEEYLYEITSLSSKDIRIQFLKDCRIIFDNLKPDIIINLSGINYDKFIHKLDFVEDYFKINNILDVNVKGSVNIAAGCLPGMRERGYGRLIYISSVLATKNVVGTGLYSACKAFIDRLVKSISLENISKGITANSIRLGYFDGGMTERVPDNEKVKETIPLKRWGTIEELCNTIEYIINTEYLTGANIELNGGIS